MQANQQIRPPIVSFEKRPVEDREASIKAGRVVHKDIDFIVIVPHGSGGKTKVEYVYAEWLQRIKLEGEKGDEYNPSRFPGEWIDRIEKAYASWNSGTELPMDGTSVRNWAAITPAQALNCEGAGYRTIEDLAGANEEGIGRLGMGGRAMVQKAQAWIRVADSDESKISARLDALEQRNKELQARNEELEAANQKLAAQIDEE